MLVTVIIPIYNEEKDIRDCLESLRQQSFKDFETIVIDDGSTDRTLEIVKEFKDVKVFEQDHRGPGKARNLGAKNANGKILIFIDADMTFDKNYLKNLIKPIIKNKKIIGTTHDYETATNTKNIWSRCWGGVRISRGKEAMVNTEDVKIFRAIRKDKFLEMGGFDSKYGYADDQTFWFKFGVKPVVAKNTICYHKNPESLEETFKQAKWIGASWKERFGIFRVKGINYIALGLFWIGLPFLVFVKALKSHVEGVGFKDKFKFFWVKFKGYFVGIKNSVFRGEVWR